MPYKDHQKQLQYLRKWREEHPDYWRERYHRLQDEYGYHGDPREWLPVAKMKEAFLNGNYEVVEIGTKPEIKSDQTKPHIEGDDLLMEVW